MLMQHRKILLGEGAKLAVLAVLGFTLEVRDVVLMVIHHVAHIGRVERLTPQRAQTLLGCGR